MHPAWWMVGAVLKEEQASIRSTEGGKKEKA